MKIEVHYCLVTIWSISAPIGIHSHSFQQGTNITLQAGASATVTIRSGIDSWNGFSQPGNDPGGTILATSTVFTIGSNVGCQGDGAGQTSMVPNPIST